MPTMMITAGPPARRSSSLYALAVFSVLCLSLAAALLLAFPAAAQERGAPQTGLKREALSITTAGGKVHDFSVEIADTAESRARGLMFYENLAAECRAVLLGQVVADPRAHHADEGGCVLPADHLLHGAGQGSDHIAEEAGLIQVDLAISDSGRHTAPSHHPALNAAPLCAMARVPA